MITLLNSDPEHERIIINACWDLNQRYYTQPPKADEVYDRETIKSWWKDDFNAILHDTDREEAGVSFENEKDYLMFVLRFDKPCVIQRPR